MVIQELKMYEDNPMAMAMQKWQSYYRGNNSYGRPIIGTETNIKAFTQQMLIDCSIIVSPIYDGKLKMYNFTELTNNSFTVYGENGKFNWLVIGKRHDILVEPEKEEVKLCGKGPYLWS